MNVAEAIVTDIGSPEGAPDALDICTLALIKKIFCPHAIFPCMFDSPLVSRLLPGGYNHSDFTCDGIVDVNDLMVLADQWLHNCP